MSRNVMMTTCQIGNGGIVSVIKLENGGYDVELDRVSQCQRLNLDASAMSFHLANCLAETIRLEPQNGLGDISYFPQAPLTEEEKIMATDGVWLNSVRTDYEEEKEYPVMSEWKATERQKAVWARFDELMAQGKTENETAEIIESEFGTDENPKPLPKAAESAQIVAWIDGVYYAIPQIVLKGSKCSTPTMALSPTIRTSHTL